MGLILLEGKDVIVGGMAYNDISLRDEYPYFEATKGSQKDYIDNQGNFFLANQKLDI